MEGFEIRIIVVTAVERSVAGRGGWVGRAVCWEWWHCQRRPRIWRLTRFRGVLILVLFQCSDMRI